MALVTPVAFAGLAGNSYPAARLRRVHQLLLGGREGVLAAGDMLVTPTSTPSLSVRVAAGAAVVNGDDATRQGSYLVENDAQLNVGPITTPHGSLARIDRLVLEVLDKEGTGSGGGGRVSDTPQCRIVAGTPSASPAAPAEPATAITLALITVAAGASAIVSGDITDWRPACNPQAGPTGTTGFTALTTAPWGALLLNGGTFDAARYPTLAAALGGNTLPDARGRTMIGAGAGPGLTTRNIGEMLGAEGLPQHDHGLGSHTHTLPSHTHGAGTLTTGSVEVYPAKSLPSITASAWQWKGVAAGTGQALGVWNDIYAGLDSTAGGYHNHTISGSTGSWSGTSGAASGSTASTGTGTHGVMQPSLVQTAYIWV